MPMLTFETFLLLLLAGLLGLLVGHFFGGGFGDVAWSTDRPWLRDGHAAPPAPVLPAPPSLLSESERARLSVAVAETKRVAVAPTPMAAKAPAASPPIAASEPAKPAAMTTSAKSIDPIPVPAPTPATVSSQAEPIDPAPLSAKPMEPPPAPVPAGHYTLPAEMAAATSVVAIAPEDAERAADADAVGVRPPALTGPIGGKGDDLKRIKGIGPQNERRLHGLGIYHFAQIAAWTVENAHWAGSFMAFPGRIEREDWIGQAKVLATGAETEFSKRVDAGEVPTSL